MWDMDEKKGPNPFFFFLLFYNRSPSTAAKGEFDIRSIGNRLFPVFQQNKKEVERMWSCVPSPIGVSFPSIFFFK